ncbi:MAG: chorismate-binding protein, partial [Rhodocyclaceae bacterium]
VSLVNGVASADALAGTAWVGSSPDAGLGSPRLLSDDKNGREQGLVVDAVSAALRSVCDDLQVPPAPEVLRLRGLQHLRSRVQGRVKPGVGLFDLVARLHPTPAVGGVPTAAAQQWLRRQGEQRRAWYSGGVGWIAPNGDGEVCVALRCALITGREAELYAGAGIVPGSVPEEELAETEAKLGPMLDALARAAAERQPALVRTGTQ